MAKELTLEALDKMKPGTIIAHGEAINAPHDLYMSSEPAYQGRTLLWAAVRGEINDFAVYTHWIDKGLQYVIDQGDKVMSEVHIKRLIPNMSPEAFARYRF